MDMFLGYVERTYIGKLNTRTGRRKDPMFNPSMWNIFHRVMNDEPTTNNAIELWNAKWNNAHRANHNVARVIGGFKAEDALARTKFQQQVAGRLADPNPVSSDRRSARHEQLKVVMMNYQKNNVNEFMFGLRNDA